MPPNRPVEPEVAERLRRMIALMRVVTPEREFTESEQERVRRMMQSISSLPRLPGETEEDWLGRLEQRALEALHLDKLRPVRARRPISDAERQASQDAQMRRI